MDQTQQVHPAVHLQLVKNYGVVIYPFQINSIIWETETLFIHYAWYSYLHEIWIISKIINTV